MKRRVLSILMAIAVVITSMALPRFVNPKVVEAATLDDLDQSQIVQAMGAGWNLGNALEATNNGIPSETAWGNPTITKSMIQAIKNAGFRTIRIPVSWLNYIGNAPDDTINATWMKRVKEVVDYAIECGLYVTINLHGDGYKTVTGGWLLPGSSDQTTIKNKYKKVWTQIATTFADYDEHLIFESMNEIGAEANYDWSIVANYYKNINDYNQIFVDTVRSTGGNNAKRWLLVPGWNTNIDFTADDHGFVVPSDRYCTASGKRIMISVHYYSPWEFCGSEDYNVTQWGKNASGKVASWGDETYLVSQIQKMYNKFVTQGYPVVIGEYGSVDKSAGDATNTTYRAYFAKRICELSKQYGCIPVIWDNGYNGNYGFGLFNRSTGAITQQKIIDAITGVYSSNVTPTPTVAPTIVPTVTPTAVPTVTPTTAPTTVPTLGPTTSPTSGNLDVKFIGTTTTNSTSVVGKYKLTNNGTSSIALNSVKLRYYFTEEGTQTQNFYSDWSSIGSENITGTFVAITPAKQMANYYLEIGFSSGTGSLNPGQSVEVHTRFSKSDWSNYDLTNDYSNKSTGTSYESWNKITAYQSNTLVYGVEP